MADQNSQKKIIYRKLNIRRFLESLIPNKGCPKINVGFLLRVIFFSQDWQRSSNFIIVIGRFPTTDTVIRKYFYWIYII